MNRLTTRQETNGPQTMKILLYRERDIGNLKVENTGVLPTHFGPLRWNIAILRVSP
jgi:hypothetical protein